MSVPLKKAEDTVPKKVLIIDDDSTTGQYMQQMIAERGVKDIEVFDQSDVAWENALKKDYDFIVLDWKMPKLNGISLLNRFRQHEKYYKIPILIASGFISHKDFTLLEEFILTGIVEKPVQKLLLHRKLKTLFMDSKWFAIKEEQIQSILADLHEESSEKAFQQLGKLLDEAYHPEAIALASAKILISQNRLPKAEQILLQVLDKSPKSTLLLNELGKIKLLQKSFSEANKILQKIQANSPENLERLLLLGKMNLQQLDTNQAENYFDKALKIDSSNSQAKVGKNLATDMKDYIDTNQSSTVPQSFASVLNSIGISHVKNKDFVKGMENYNAAMSYIAEPDIKAKLSYNMGLGYLRWHKFEDALQWFQKAVDYSVDFNRPKELIQKMKKILKMIDVPVPIPVTKTKKSIPILEEEDFETELLLEEMEGPIDLLPSKPLIPKPPQPEKPQLTPEEEKQEIKIRGITLDFEEFEDEIIGRKH